MPLPLAWRPDRGSSESLKECENKHEFKSMVNKETVLYELLPVVPGFGLNLLPEPTAGDVFLDLEGDPFVGEHGLEFLFGYAYVDDIGKQVYQAEWALDRSDEKASFERFIDFVTRRIKQYPVLHVYHFASYEPAALKRLMGRYATREEEVDYLLRSRRFIDLFAVVRHCLRADVELLIEELEPLYGFERTIELSRVNTILAKAQACLELGDVNHS